MSEFFRLSRFLTLLNEGVAIDEVAAEVSGVNNLGVGNRRDDFRADFTGVFAREGWFPIAGVDWLEFIRERLGVVSSSASGL